MARGWIHTVPSDSGWRNDVEGEDATLGDYDTKEEAERAGRDEAQRRATEHVIHNADGTIGERNSYGNDPHNVPG